VRTSLRDTGGVYGLQKRIDNDCSRVWPKDRRHDKNDIELEIDTVFFFISKIDASRHYGEHRLGKRFEEVSRNAGLRFHG